MGSGYSYQWFLNGSVLPSATNASFVATQAGNYTCEVSVNGCSVVSNGITVSVIPSSASNIIANGPTSFCAGGNVTLNGQSGYVYQWLLNGNTIAGATNNFFVASISGSYTCNVIVLGNLLTSNAIIVNVNSIPSNTISTSGSTNVCAGTNVVLSSTTQSGAIYQWRLNGSNISGAVSSSFTATVSGNYTCVIGVNNCVSSSNAISVNFNNPPAAPIVANGNTSFCLGSNVNLAITNSSSGLSYQWQQNGVNIANANSQSYNANQSGTYTCLVSQNGCIATSSGISVVVLASPSTPSISQIPNTFTLLSTAANGYQWFFNNSLILGAVNQFYNATANGNYTVVVADANACSSVSLPFSVLGLGINERLLNSSFKMFIYPNPSSDVVHIKIESEKNTVVKLQIINIFGQIVYSKIIENRFDVWTETLDAKMMASGIYTVKMATNNGFVTKNLVIVH